MFRRYPPSLVCFIYLYAGAVEAEENQNRLTEGGVSEYQEDMIFMVVTSLLFAFVISMFGSVFGYITYLDDAILKKYKSEASKVEADVISSEFARGGTKSGDVIFEASQKEYSVVVEYNQLIQLNAYRVRVRKRVRAWESDFVHPHHPELNPQKSIYSAEQRVFSMETIGNLTVKESDLEALATAEDKTKNPKIIFNKDSFFQRFLVEERKLELLVMDQFPKSGFSSQQLKRRLGFRYRSSSLIFLLCSMVLTLFCIHMAFRMVIELDDVEELPGSVGYGLVIGCTIAILFQIPCIHWVMNGTLQQMLEDEYYDSGDLTQTAQDDSTLSSGSDMFLSHQYQSIDSGLL